MATEIERVWRVTQDRLADIWNWPVIDGNDYSNSDRQSVKKLSHYFTTIAIAGVSGYAAYNSSSVVSTLTSAALAILGGHYLAAGLVHWRHIERRHHGP